MNRITCVNAGVYTEALTRGKYYDALEINDTQGQVRLRGDNGRTRWFPYYCFDLQGKPAKMLVDFELEDPEYRDEHTVSVTSIFSDGEQRWSYFVSTNYFQKYGQQLKGTSVLYNHGLKHMIVVSELSDEHIGAILAEIDNNNELVDCSLPVEPVDLDIDDEEVANT